jgi:hypothetical protein
MSAIASGPAAAAAAAARREMVKVVCYACNEKEIPVIPSPSVALVAGEDRTSRLNLAVHEMFTKLETAVRMNVSGRCSCAVAQALPPQHDALDPPQRPIVCCNRCGSSFCAVCGKQGGCPHSSLDYKLHDVLKPHMILWNAVRPAHALAIGRAFVIVERFLKALHASQRAELLRSSVCPVLPVLDASLRISVAECSQTVFRLNRGWAALSDEDNASKIKKLFDALNVETADLKVV